MSATDESAKQLQHMGKLGNNYQLKLLYELTVPNNINESTKNPFFEEINPFLEVSYFETLILRKIMVIIKDYYKKYNTAPNLENIFTMSSDINNETERKEIEATLIKIRALGVKYKSGEINDDRRFIKEQALNFVRQRELAKLNAESSTLLEKGIINEHEFNNIADKYKSIMDIGKPHRNGKDLFEALEEVLSENYRRPIGTGIKEIDSKVAGGPDRGEFCLILAPPGIGKTSLLSLISANNYLLGKNVLHIILEGKENDIRRKLYAKMLNIPSSQLSKRKEEAIKKIEALKTNTSVGSLKVARLSDDTTPSKLKKYIKKEEDKRGKFDLVVLDYIDCLEPDEKNSNTWDGQQQVVKRLESMCEELDVAMYVAIQAKKEANNKRILGMEDCGGSVERLKKAHMVISLGRELSQLNSNQINIAIIKCRFAKAGWVWEDVFFDNDSLTIKVDDSHNHSFNETLVIPEEPNSDRIDDSKIKKITGSIENFENQSETSKKIGLIDE